MVEKIYADAKFYPERYGAVDEIIWPTSRDRKTFRQLPTGHGGLYLEPTKRENDWIRAEHVYKSKILKDSPKAMVCFPHCNPVLAFRSDIHWGNVKHLFMFEHNEDIYNECKNNLPKNINLLRQVAKKSSKNKFNTVEGELFNTDFFSSSVMNLQAKDWTSEELAPYLYHHYDGIGIWDLDVWNVNQVRLQKVSYMIDNLSPNNFVVRLTMWPRCSIQKRIDTFVQKVKPFSTLVDSLSLRHAATTEQKTSVDPFIWQGLFERKA